MRSTNLLLLLLLLLLEVIETDTDPSATYDFLLTYHSNHGPISYRFRDNGNFSRKSIFWPTPVYFAPHTNNTKVQRKDDRQTDRHMLRKLECRVDAETASVWCVLHTQGTANTTPCINRLRSGCYPLNFVTCFRLEKRLRTVLHGEKV